MSRFFRALALAVIAACGDPSTTRYVGTVMSEVSPEAAGTLALTLFSRDDSSCQVASAFGNNPRHPRGRRA